MEREDYKAEYELVKSKGIPVVIMEPVRGGFLAKTVPNALLFSIRFIILMPQQYNQWPRYTPEFRDL